jgi:hypothetical protein
VNFIHLLSSADEADGNVVGLILFINLVVLLIRRNLVVRDIICIEWRRVWAVVDRLCIFSGSGQLGFLSFYNLLSLLPDILELVAIVFNYLNV